MDYIDTDGNPATGVVWSPGPIPGTVWVLADTSHTVGHLGAVPVDIATRRELSDESWRKRRDRWNFDHNAKEGDPTRRLAPKDWHAALGFNPAERVQCFEGNDAPTLLDISA